VIISANFRQPAASNQRLKRVVMLLGGLFVLSAVAAGLMYALSVQAEYKVTGLGKKARELNEDNRMLQVELNRVSSFERVAIHAENQLPLGSSDEVLEIAPSAKTPANPGSAQKTALPPYALNRPYVPGY
jgi:hypothetical protein